MILLTCINPRLKWIYALGSHIGVKMTIFGIIPKVKPGWNISWECSIPLNPPIFIIYRIKLILLTCINPRLKWICALGSHIGVKITIFGVTPKLKLLFLIIYPNKFPGLALHLIFRFLICRSAHDNGVIYPIIKSRLIYSK